MYNTCRDIQKRRINEENLKQNDENAPNETGALGSSSIIRDKPGTCKVQAGTGGQKMTIWTIGITHEMTTKFINNYTSGILPAGCNELYTVNHD